ncbi:MAG: hypothetical protein LBN21_12505 [Treponema sp.]|jgi:TPR repeat protein|nr:hypothetical protein [Treponema sp.]
MKKNDALDAQCAEGLHYFEQANPRCEEDIETYNDNGYYWWNAVWDEDLMSKALAALTAVAEKGYAPAQCALAECYWKLSKVLSEMMDHLMFFYDHSYSQSELIEDNEELEDIEKYWDKGFEWYEKAAEQGYPKALNYLTQAAKERFYKPAKTELQNYLDELQYEAEEGKYHGEI